MPREVEEIVRFQIEVADGWIRESREESAHPRLRFIGYFMAFNALYWLWGMLEGTHQSEVARIQALVEELGLDTANRILSRHSSFMGFLISRGPIRRMDKRSRTSAAGHPGDGTRFLALLQDRAPTTKLKGLASILYLIRCNLVHGSKVAHAEGADLVRQSIPPLRSIAEACLEYSRNRPPR
jgi:hypothetical protein